MESEKEILENIKISVQNIDSEADVVLFGSRARRDHTFDSDWDILILTDNEVNLDYEQLFREAIFLIEIEYGQAISTFLYSKKDWNSPSSFIPLIDSIKNDGIIL